MGKFSGVLIASDYDNTMVYTEGSLRSGGPVPAIPRENRDAIEYFMAQGGTFSVATGRALPSFASVMDGVPMNGPTVLFNGAAIYDFRAEKYLCTAFLPETVRGHLAPLAARFPQIGVELYHDDNSIHVVNPNEITARHLHLTHTPSQQIASLDQAPSPISKLLFEEEPQRLRQLEEAIRAQDWSREYEVVASAVNLLEITARGANKGGMVRRLAELDPAKYDEDLAKLELKAKRAAERKSEAARHEKNLRRGIKRPKKQAGEAADSSSAKAGEGKPAGQRPSGPRKSTDGRKSSGTGGRTFARTEGDRPRPTRNGGSRPSKSSRPKPRGKTNPYAHSRPVKKGKGSFRKKES